jgi:transposase InsO family protein
MQRWATLCRDARPLEAARRVRRRIVQIAGGARSRDGISPPATACAEAVRASQAQVTHSRPADLRLAVPAVPVAARSCGHLPARDAGTLASEWLPPVLALEIRSRVGRPAIPAEIRNLVRAVSRDNPLWGAPRIHGELLKLGIDIAQSTVARYMPRRHRPPSPSWRAFLRSHTAHIAAIDLFVVPTIGFKLLYGLVILRLERRRLVWTNVTANPPAEWIARQIVEAFPWDEAPRYLIRDRDTSYGAAVTRRLRTMGIRDRPITPRSPWQNGHVERLIGSIRRECLDHVVVFGESHLRHLLAKYSAYYDEARTHLALDKDTPVHRPAQTVGRIASISWLDGLHRQYVRMA